MVAVYLDTNVFIRAFESAGDVSRALIDLFAVNVAQPGLATSELTLAELLVHPYRDQDRIGQARYDRAIRPSTWLHVQPVDRTVLAGAAWLRSQYRLKLPDAIHVSTALHLGCDLLLTDDGGLGGKFRFSWPDRLVETIPLDLPSVALATKQLRA